MQKIAAHDPKDLMSLYVAFLRSLYHLYQDSHWKSHGNNFYGNHLLFQRLYESTQEDVDTAAEKTMGLFGELEPQHEAIVGISERYDMNHFGDNPAKGMLEAERAFLAMSEQVYKKLKESGALSLGLDDMIMSIASRHEVNTYLLQQVLRNDTGRSLDHEVEDSMAEESTADETPEPAEDFGLVNDDDPDDPDELDVARDLWFRHTPEFQEWKKKFFSYPPDVGKWMKDNPEYKPVISGMSVEQITEFARKQMREDKKYKKYNDFLEKQKEPQGFKRLPTPEDFESIPIEDFESIPIEDFDKDFADDYVKAWQIMNIDKLLVFASQFKKVADDSSGEFQQLMNQLGFPLLPEADTTEQQSESAQILPINNKNQTIIAGLNPQLQSLAKEFLQIAARENIPVVLTNGYRSIDEQNALYEQGRTTPGAVVTNAKGGISKHNYGLAFDVAPLNKNGQPYWPNDEQLWQQIGNLGKSVGLKWGGDWANKDRPHFELDQKIKQAAMYWTDEERDKIHRLRKEYARLIKDRNSYAAYAAQRDNDLNGLRLERERGEEDPESHETARIWATEARHAASRANDLDWAANRVYNELNDLGDPGFPNEHVFLDE